MLKRTFIPRIAETNLITHIRQDVIVVWLGESSIDIHKLFSSDLQVDRGLIAVNVNVDFTNEIVLGKDVEVTTSVKNIGKSSLVLLQNVYQDGRLCAKGLVTYIYYNYLTKKAESIPQAIRFKLDEHLLKE